METPNPQTGVARTKSGFNHKQCHEELHRALDELIADFIGHTGRLPSKATIMELISWSYEQTQNPTETDN